MPGDNPSLFDAAQYMDTPGAFTSGPVSAPVQGNGGNDVLNTILGAADKTLNLLTNVEMARIRTRAAPGGSVGSNVYNPQPGTQGPYPQAEAKPQPGGVGGIGANFLVIGIIVLIAFAIIFRR